MLESMTTVLETAPTDGYASKALAFAKVDQPDALLFTALARVAEWSVSEFNEQKLANIAWSFAMTCESVVQLFRALARVAEQRVADFIA